MKKILILFVLVAGLLVAGCQVDEPIDEPYEETLLPTEENDDEVPAFRVIEVEGYGRTFEPDVIEIEVGETIEFVFTNTGGFHDLIIPSLGVGTEMINEGETDSFVYTFEEPGSFEFICSVGNHAAEGMVGEIIVS